MQVPDSHSGDAIFTSGKYFYLGEISYRSYHFLEVLVVRVLGGVYESPDHYFREIFFYWGIILPWGYIFTSGIYFYLGKIFLLRENIFTFGKFFFKYKSVPLYWRGGVDERILWLSFAQQKRLRPRRRVRIPGPLLRHGAEVVDRHDLRQGQRSLEPQVQVENGRRKNLQPGAYPTKSYKYCFTNIF
jgi:hypothetical protein